MFSSELDGRSSWRDVGEKKRSTKTFSQPLQEAETSSGRTPKQGPLDRLATLLHNHGVDQQEICLDHISESRTMFSSASLDAASLPISSFVSPLQDIEYSEVEKQVKKFARW